MVNLRVSAISSELVILLQPNLVWWHQLERLVKRLDCTLVFSVKVTAKVQISVNVSLDIIFSFAKPFVTKLGMEMQHHVPECSMKRLVCYFKVKVTVRAKNMKFDCF